MTKHGQLTAAEEYRNHNLASDAAVRDDLKHWQAFQLAGSLNSADLEHLKADIKAAQARLTTQATTF